MSARSSQALILPQQCWGTFLVALLPNTTDHKLTGDLLAIAPYQSRCQKRLDNQVEIFHSSHAALRRLGQIPARGGLSTKCRQQKTPQQHHRHNGSTERGRVDGKCYVVFGCPSTSNVLTPLQPIGGWSELDRISMLKMEAGEQA